jgi:hypothetical protein
VEDWDDMLVDRGLELQLFEGRFQPQALQKHRSHDITLIIKRARTQHKPTDWSFLKAILYTLDMEKLYVHCAYNNPTIYIFA